MTTTAVLRGVTFALAALGVVDPTWTVQRSAPVPVDVRVASASATADDRRLVGDVKNQLRSTLADRAIINSAVEPAALVLVGGHTSANALPDSTVPVSTVAPLTPAAPGVRIVAASGPAPVPLGWTATFEATIEASGRRGTTSRIFLQQGDAEVAHVDHTWTNDRERFDVMLAYAPPVEGSSRVTLRVDDKACAEPCRGAAVDLRAVAVGRRLKVLAHEPRPSWATAFVRRALEEDAIFDVASLVRSSRSLSVRGGSPPPTLTADALAAFDVVLVGAPEELRAAEVDALRSFARRRGGTVVLLPDRRPSGPYLELMPDRTFDEMLVDAPLDLKAENGATFRASELAIPRERASSMDVLATVASQKESKPVIVAWPSGIGTITFSGALDAWRYRATAGEGFARFWRAQLAEAALAAPPRVQVSLSPDIARPGEEVIVRARLRPTEVIDAPGRTSVPAVRAMAIAPKVQEEIRLWPTAEAGTFEGRWRASAVGTFDVQVTVDNGAVGDDVLTVVADAAHAERDRGDALTLVASATGGVSVTAADLGPLARHLRSLPAGTATETWHPTRSAWFVVVFVAVSCGEWAFRRRRGQL
jgi:hypothetical protein